MSFRLAGRVIRRAKSIQRQAFRATSTKPPTTSEETALNFPFSPTQPQQTPIVMDSSEYFVDLLPLEPLPSLQRVLSAKTVKKRVAERVAERNRWPEYQYFPGNLQFLKYLCRNFSDIVTNFDVPSNLDDVFPLQEVDWEAIRKPPSPLQVTWIGHASLLVQMDGCNMLTDPVFSQRCAPTQFAGPLRYRPPAFMVEDLVEQEIPIDYTLISHNHYDHLDYKSAKDLAKAFPGATFVVPLGLESWFQRHVSKKLNIVQLDWHECYSPIDNEIHITAIPMCHWSNRLGWDRDKSLWCGFIIEGMSQKKFLFPGDTGWFDGLHEIGRRYGPIDLAALPIGAYQPPVLMRASHTNPEEAVEMMTALGVKQAVPIHWGTFPLTLEPVMEPRERLTAAVKAAGMDASAFAPWLVGETVVCKK